MTYLELVHEDGSMTACAGTLRDIEYLTVITLNGIEYGFLDCWVGKDAVVLVYGAI